MKKRTVYVCKNCDYQTSQWLGRCPECGTWNSLIEETFDDAPSDDDKKSARRSLLTRNSDESEPVLLSSKDIPDYMRSSTGMEEFDRALGGGLVSGSAVLLSGEPGIGKSTLLLQVCASLAGEKKVLYVSGEESAAQISMRAKRLGIKSDNLWLLTETDAEKVLKKAEKLSPDVIVVDSIQTMYHSESSTIPGSVTQIRESAAMFINKAKTDGVSVLLVGHVNKEGGIAGPKILEHMVDTVLYFEGERHQNFRIVRAIKNRFGSTSEIGVFEMTDRGLREVENPSEMLMADRPKNVSGNCAVCVMEGTRPIIAEIQALSSPTVFPSPRRMSSGIDYNRLSLIIAVIEKRLGLHFSSSDVYVNVIGGMKIEETASDAAAVLALISSARDIPVPDDLIAFGEIGLSGEVRAVSRVEQRVSEAIRLGFTRIAVPKRCAERLEGAVSGVEIIPIKTIFDLLPLMTKQQ